VQALCFSLTFLQTLLHFFKLSIHLGYFELAKTIAEAFLNKKKNFFKLELIVNTIAPRSPWHEIRQSRVFVPTSHQFSFAPLRRPHESPPSSVQFLPTGDWCPFPSSDII
jgi:hypothetical protein